MTGCPASIRYRDDCSDGDDDGDDYDGCWSCGCCVLSKCVEHLKSFFALLGLALEVCEWSDGWRLVAKKKKKTRRQGNQSQTNKSLWR